MSSAVRQLEIGVSTLVALGALLSACNQVIGIEEPTPIPILDGSFIDTGRGGAAGRGGSTSGSGGSAAGNPGGSGGGGTGGSGGGQPSAGDAGIADGPGIRDVVVSTDLPAPRDIAFLDRGGSGGGTIVDSGSGGARPDGGDAGPLVAPGQARGTCGFLDIKDANADTTLFVSSQGSAARKTVGGNEIIEIYLTNFMAGVQRNLNVRIRAPIAPGMVLPLDDVTTVEYYDVKTGAGWSSTAITPPSGTLTISSVAGTSFSFTIGSTKMGSVLMGVGMMTLNGSGSAHPQ